MTSSSNSESEDSCSSEYSTDSSEDDGMETLYACGTKLQLPQGLCERQDIFNEFFTVDLWNSFSDEDKEHLQSFLPNFPGDEYEEKTKTLQRLFDFENFRFSNPLVKFFEHLKAGYLRPEIAQLRKQLNKKEIKEAKYRHKIYRNQLKEDILESQSKLLNKTHKHPKPPTDNMYLYDRTKKCYFQTLGAIKAKVDEQNLSPDENHPEGPCQRLSRKQKRHLNSIRNGLSKKKLFSSTMDTKLNGNLIDLEKYITSYQNPFYINDESYRNLLSSHRKRKLENASDPELDVDVDNYNMRNIENQPTITELIENTVSHISKFSWKTSKGIILKLFACKDEVDNYNMRNIENQPTITELIENTVSHISKFSWKTSKGIILKLFACKDEVDNYNMRNIENQPTITELIENTVSHISKFSWKTSKGIILKLFACKDEGEKLIFPKFQIFPVENYTLSNIGNQPTITELIENTVSRISKFS
ncbi:unnamed protein product [Ceutorhynchus assimilis]|uniref:DEUBAD domain-containing protein n=1 Tax=Ceutorhynchus assimilis TaxID=467358 RepID=A0A9N9QKT3_9CUCU|nr:unnamed protein product [Ceutorhynchus assimilis]